MKQPLLLLHGAISSAKQFDNLIPLLKDQFEVHTISFPGHGGNGIPDEPFSIPFFASAILNFLNEKQISTVSIFGYSMGGYVGFYLASHYPERINKVFTLATKFDWNTETAKKESGQLNPEKILEKIPAFAQSLEQIHHPQNWKIVLNKTAELLLDLGNSPAVTVNEFLQIKCPVTISRGELDKMVSQTESQFVAEKLKNGRLLVLPGVPHPFEKADPTMLTEHIRNFFL